MLFLVRKGAKITEHECDSVLDFMNKFKLRFRKGYGVPHSCDFLLDGEKVSPYLPENSDEMLVKHYCADVHYSTMSYLVLTREGNAVKSAGTCSAIRPSSCYRMHHRYHPDYTKVMAEGIALLEAQERAEQERLKAREEALEQLYEAVETALDTAGLERTLEVLTYLTTGDNHHE